MNFQSWGTSMGGKLRKFQGVLFSQSHFSFTFRENFHLFRFSTPGDQAFLGAQGDLSKKRTVTGFNPLFFEKFPIKNETLLEPPGGPNFHEAQGNHLQNRKSNRFRPTIFLKG